MTDTREDRSTVALQTSYEANLRLVEEWLRDRPRVRVNAKYILKTLGTPIRERLANADRWLAKNPTLTLVTPGHWDHLLVPWCRPVI